MGANIGRDHWADEAFVGGHAKILSVHCAAHCHGLDEGFIAKRHTKADIGNFFDFKLTFEMACWEYLGLSREDTILVSEMMGMNLI